MKGKATLLLISPAYDDMSKMIFIDILSPLRNCSVKYCITYINLFIKMSRFYFFFNTKHLNQKADSAPTETKVQLFWLSKTMQQYFLLYAGNRIPNQFPEVVLACDKNSRQGKAT